MDTQMGSCVLYIFIIVSIPLAFGYIAIILSTYEWKCQDAVSQARREGLGKSRLNSRPTK